MTIVDRLNAIKARVARAEAEARRESGSVRLIVVTKTFDSDAIHSIDRRKIAEAIAREMERRKRRVDLLVQVNTGEEPQKAGVAPDGLPRLLQECRQLGLAIAGLMAIPPEAESPGPHFALLAKLAREHGLSRLSMGMSGDFETAIAFGATEVRVGSAIMGDRPPA